MKVVNRSRWLKVKLNQWKDDWWPDWGRRQTEEGQRKQKHRGRVGIELGGLVVLLGNRDERSTLASWEKMAWNQKYRRDETGQHWEELLCNGLQEILVQGEQSPQT